MGIRARNQSQAVTVTIHRDGAMCFIPVTFDPRPHFGKLRAPVKVTLNGYTYRSTIFSMGGVTFIPLRKSHREAAGLKGDETVKVRIALDTTTRKVALPPDLARALKTRTTAAKSWDTLSYTSRREHVEAILGAKKPETRARRLANTLRALGQRTRGA
jgi:hypothetical protein